MRTREESSGRPTLEERGRRNVFEEKELRS